MLKVTGSHRVMYGTRRNASKVEIPSSMNLWSSGYSHSQFLEAFQRQACGHHWSEGRTLKASPRELGPNRICWDGLGNDGTCPEKAWSKRLNFPGLLWNFLGTLTFDGSCFFFPFTMGPFWGLDGNTVSCGGLLKPRLDRLGYLHMWGDAAGGKDDCLNPAGEQT